MKVINTEYIKGSELLPVEELPPNDHCGWYGIIVKPKWMPKWFAWLIRNKLPIFLGWLNTPLVKKPYDDPKHERYWFVYPTGSNFTPTGKHVRGLPVKPFLWCELKKQNQNENNLG